VYPSTKGFIYSSFSSGGKRREGQGGYPRGITNVLGKGKYTGGERSEKERK